MMGCVVAFGVVKIVIGWWFLQGATVEASFPYGTKKNFLLFSLSLVKVLLVLV
jgi:hypothetical protein